MNMTELRQLIPVVTKDIEALGLTIPTNTKYELSARYSRKLGNCNQRHMYGRVYITITLAQMLPVELARNVLMHELLHASVGVQEGHGGLWAEYAHKANRMLGYKIARLASREDTKTFAEVKAQSGVGYTATCTSCGGKSVVTARHGIVKHPENYRCKCKGTFKVERN